MAYDLCAAAVCKADSLRSDHVTDIGRLTAVTFSALAANAFCKADWPDR